jgi:hypothetical protein
MSTPSIQYAVLDVEMKAALEAARVASANDASVVVDLTAIRTGVIAALTAIATLATAVNVLATKLNADAGVTDTNYVTSNAVGQVAASSPAALTTV